MTADAALPILGCGKQEQPHNKQVLDKLFEADQASSQTAKDEDNIYSLQMSAIKVVKEESVAKFEQLVVDMIIMK